jgi:hypothetical protein
MSYITAYYAIFDPIMGRLPLEESIISIEPHVDAIVVYDCSKYDRVDLSRYGKVKKHVFGKFNPYDNPFGSAFTQGLRLVDSDVAMFMDADEIFSFNSIGLRDIIKQFPLESGAGIAFSLRNYYCDRHHILDGPSSKGPHVFRNRKDISHDMIGQLVVPLSNIRRVNQSPDSNDGVRICDDQGVPISHYQPVDPSVAIIHHTSHLDFVGKYIRSICQFNHTSVIDIPALIPYDMRVSPAVIELITKQIEQDIRNNRIELYGAPIKIQYEPNELLERFIKRTGIMEFDPDQIPGVSEAENIQS